VLQSARRILAPPDTGGGFRPDIEGLRGLAILLVVLFHARLVGIDGGFVGVDVFFVISGFLITGLLLRERERAGVLDLTRFYARRVRRLLPAAAVVLTVTMLAVHVLIAPLDRAELQLDGLASALSFGNMRFAAEAGDYFSAVSTPSPFLHFWSLGVEEQFYLVWPALVLLASRGRRPRLAVGLVLLGVALASLVASIVVTDIAANWAFYSLPTRAWQLAVGGLLAVGATQVARAPSRLLAGVGWGGVAAIGASAVLFTESMAYPGLAAILPTAGAAALIAAGAARGGPAMVLTLAPMRWLGRISYSLYLWHWPLLVLVPLAVGAELDTAARLALVVAAVAISTVSWAAIEEPFRRGFPLMTRRPGRTVAVGLASVGLIAVMAGNLSLMSARAVESIGGTGIETTDDWESVSNDELDAAWDEWDDEDAIASEEWDSDDADDDDQSPGPGKSPAPDTNDVDDEGDSAPTRPGSGSAQPTDEPTSAADPTMKPTRQPAGPDGTPRPEPAQPTDAPPDAEPTPDAQPTPATSNPPVTTDFALAADVTPPLAKARSNTEHLGRCLAAESVLTPPDCVFGEATGGITVALVGDSHASQWFPALKEIARHRGWRIVTFVKMNCPFIDMPVKHLVLKREYTECRTWNEAVIGRLGSIRPDLTLASMSRWSVRPIGTEGVTIRDQAAAIARLLVRIPGTKAVLADTPYAKIDIPACLSANLTDIRRCSISRSVAFGGRALSRERQAAEMGGAGLVDLNPTICPGTERCPAVLDNKIVYRDEHHLTAVFSRWLAPPLDAALAPLLGG
jgi:peptidoglycan/LPS O-acetylase OafA/YrhL